MGRFANKVSAATKQRSSIIKVNPYELPEKALAVIANICTKQNQDNASVIFEALMPVLLKEYNQTNFFDTIENTRHSLYDVDLVDSIDRVLHQMEIELAAHENTNDTQVVVAGGFSAGKSSFLNTITGATNLLPTGIEPVSMIATYLYLSDKINEVVVKGVNLKNAVVLLDKDVLQSIQHASKSKVYLASVLNKLFVEVPSTNLKGLVFIDTPGYNNSDKANESNGQSDQDTATNAFAEGNVLFWVVDIESGTVPAKDKMMINQFLSDHQGTGKVVIIFNKADKKPANEIRNIVDLTAREYQLGSDPTIIDVLAYSCVDNRIHYSKRGFSIPTLLNEVKKAGTGNSRIDQYVFQINQLLQDEIEFASMNRAEIERKRNEHLKDKNECHSKYINDKEANVAFMRSVREVIIEGYNQIMNVADRITDCSKFALDSYCDFYNGVLDFENNDHWGSSSVLDSAINQGKRDYDRAVKKHNEAIKYKYWQEEYRNERCLIIEQELNKLNDTYRAEYERYEQLENEDREAIQQIDSFINALKYYQKGIIDTLCQTVRNFQYSAHRPQDARLLSNVHHDIFAAIYNGNYSEFMDCFTEGVNLSTFSSDGYSPLTYAVKQGAVEMVRFFVTHNADLSALDKNGLNAFHTAVKFGYRNICEMLLKEEPALAQTETADGQNMELIAEQNTFTNWLKSIHA